MLFRSHDTSNGFYSESKRGNIDEKQIFSFLRCLTTENTTLNCSTISNSFIRVDTSIWFFAIEEILNKLLYFWNTGRTSNKYNLINLGLLEARVVENSLDWSKCLLKKVSAEFFKTCTSNSFLKIEAINQTFD